jgi:hypothetical protein
LADPKYLAPSDRFSSSRNIWVQIDAAAVEHFPRSSVPKNPN